MTDAKQGSVPVIAIDGPSASGKGTVAARVAARLGWHYLDSGALYRLVALHAVRMGVAEDDVEALTRLAAALPVSFSGDEVLLAGDSVGEAIRAEDIGLAASRVAVHPPLREALLARQRAFRQPPGLVADGRDMGSVVFPDAVLKVFLDASAGVRGERRYKQLLEKGMHAKLPDLVADMARRDARDRQRAVAPLAPAPGAVVIDTDPLDVNQVVAAVLHLWDEGTRAGHRTAEH